MQLLEVQMKHWRRLYMKLTAWMVDTLPTTTTISWHNNSVSMVGSTHLTTILILTRARQVAPLARLTGHLAAPSRRPPRTAGKAGR